MRAEKWDRADFGRSPLAFVADGHVDRRAVLGYELGTRIEPREAVAPDEQPVASAGQGLAFEALALEAPPVTSTTSRTLEPSSTDPRPSDVSRLSRALGRLFLRLCGWTVEGQRPEAAKAVLLAAPHTSNWDLPFMLAAAYAFGIRPHWLGKRALFRWPFGGFMRWLGGIPVDRQRRENVVAQAVERFAAVPRLILVIPPSGTRSRAAHWRSGFYHIARGADVPVVCTFLDYRRRVACIGAQLAMSGDVGRDMDAIRAVYADVTPKHPALLTPVRLVEERTTPEARPQASHTIRPTRAP